MKIKNNKSKNGKTIKKGEHLITKIMNGNTHKQEQEVQECKYGIFCAHLRMQGECSYPHRRNHYHFLNMVAPQNCLEDEQKTEKELSKREKKELKIIEKTINQQIDVGQLDRKENLLKNKKDQQNKKQLIAQLDENEQRVLDLVDSKDASIFFTKLKQIQDKNKQICEIKKKAMIQLKKKNEKLFVEVADKQYRIANRLIKEWKKVKGKSNLFELYVQINHNSIASVRDYFEGWFIEDQGIPQQKEGRLDVTQQMHLTKLLSQVFMTEPNQYESQCYYISTKTKQRLLQLKSNIHFFNLMIPFKAYKQMPFIKYLYINCEQLTFLKMGQILQKDYVTSFYSRFKAAPEFPFGQLEQNVNKFGNWASKIATKYSQTGCDWKLVIFIDQVASLFPTAQMSEFQGQKLKQRRQLFILLKQIFPATFIFIFKNNQNMLQQLGQFLSIQEEDIKPLSFK